MKKKIFSYIKLLIFILFFVFMDQWTKYMATIRLKGNDDVIIIKDVLHLHYLDGGNTGAAWGLLSGKINLFILFTVIAIIIISVFIYNLQNLIENNNDAFNSKRFIFLKYMMALLIAGAVGNLIDRIINGYVIYFIYFKLINFPIFNVADCYVTISCLFIVLICLFKIREDEFNKIFSFKLKQGVK